MKKNPLFLFIAVWLFSVSAVDGQHQDKPVNLLSLQEGTLPIVQPPSYPGWPAEAILDESAASGWACEEGKTSGNTFVFEMISEALLESFEFDTAAIDTEGSGAKDILVEISAVSGSSGFQTALQAALAEKADRQRFPAQKKLSGRWVRLTIKSNHGSTEYTELFSFRGFGMKPAVSSQLGNVSGTYDTDYSRFHVRQQGTALIGCYEFDEGLLNGSIEGRLMKITWQESGGKDDCGPAVMVFSTDGKSFRGYWWEKGKENDAPHGTWNGVKVSSQVGGCPHWSGSLSGELKRQLQNEGRARVYGILFDLNSAQIKPESKPVLEEVLALLKGEPGWKLTIEGHTDSSGSADFNQKLSLQRAEAVKAYLAGAGIDPARLMTSGFGTSKPVADNSSELGRAQNRRVELVRQ